VYAYVVVKFVLQRHGRNIKGRNQLVKKFADEYQFAGNVFFAATGTSALLYIKL